MNAATADGAQKGGDDRDQDEHDPLIKNDHTTPHRHGSTGRGDLEDQMRVKKEELYGHPTQRCHQHTIFDYLPSVHFYNVLMMSLAFMVVFAAYNTIQNYVTSLLPNNLGNESLGVLYVTVAFTVFTAPIIVDRLGERLTLFIGAACYVVYIAALIKIQEAVVLCAAVVIGFGAAILWVAQGALLTKCSPPDKRGRNSGIFWGIFQISNVGGNLAAYLIFDHLSSTWLFIIFTSTAAVGTAMLLLILPFKSLADDVPPINNNNNTTNDDSINHDDTTTPSSKGLINDSNVSITTDTPQQQHTHHQHHHRASLVELLRGVTRLFFDPRILLLDAMFFWSGFELAFWTGEFPQVLDSKIIGLVLSFVGMAEVVGGVSIGWISDKLGRSLTILLGAVVWGCGITFCSLLKEQEDFTLHPTILDVPLPAFAVAFCFGIGDCVFNTQTYAILGQLFGNEGSVAAFTIFQLLQNIGSAVGFFYALLLPFHGDSGTLWQVWIQIGVLVFAASTFIIADLGWNRKKKTLAQSSLYH